MEVLIWHRICIGTLVVLRKMGFRNKIEAIKLALLRRISNILANSVVNRIKGEVLAKNVPLKPLMRKPFNGNCFDSRVERDRQIVKGKIHITLTIHFD